MARRFGVFESIVLFSSVATEVVAILVARERDLICTTQARNTIVRRVEQTSQQTAGVRINERIRVPEVRVIDEKGVQLGIMPPAEALRLAVARELDLVEVAPGAQPPVCRLMNFGKYQYEQTKRERQARRAQKQIEVKEVRLRPKTGDHDTEVRMRQARRFLEDGNKVKVRVRFRGREIYHPELATEILAEFAQRLADVGQVEQQANMEGPSMLMIMAPLPSKHK